MFYCKPCGTDRGWPTDELLLMLGGSYGNCEVCRNRRECFDIPSSRLPLPPGTSPAPPWDWSGYRCFLTDGDGDRPGREVTMAEYVAAERSAGFHNTQGKPQEPATAGFSGTVGGRRVAGRVVYGAAVPR